MTVLGIRSNLSFTRRYQLLCLCWAAAMLLLSPSIFFLMFFTIKDEAGTDPTQILEQNLPVALHKARSSSPSRTEPVFDIHRRKLKQSQSERLFSVRHKPINSTRRHIADITEAVPATVITPPLVTEPRKTRVAVLALDDDLGQMNNFILSATSNLLYSERVVVKYFLFYRSLDLYLKRLMVPFQRKDVVTLLTYIVPGEVNPCRTYLENARAYSFFNLSHYDYVLSFDGRMDFLKPISMVNELLDDFVVAPHPAFVEVTDKRVLPYDRRPNSCAHVGYGSEAKSYFAPEFFGGRPDLVGDFCLAVTECQYSMPSGELDDITFHQAVNKYLLQNPPKRVLAVDFIAAESIFDTVPGAVLHLLDRLVTPSSYQQPNQWRYFEYEPGFFAQRNSKASQIAASMKSTYFKQMSVMLNFGHKLKFLGFNCLKGEVICESFEAFHSSAALLYLAVATGRAYHIVWPKVDRVFEINSHYYNVSASKFAPANNSVYIPASRMDKLLYNWSLPLAEINASDSVLITTKETHYLIGTVLAKRALYSNLHQGLPDIPDYKGAIDYSLVLSAALRILFGEVTPSVHDKVNDLILRTAKSHERWQEGAKIGIQVETCNDCVHAKVQPYQLVCFAEKVKEIIRLRMGQNPKFVFVVSDDSEVTGEMARLLQLALENSDDFKHMIVFDSKSLKAGEDSDLVDWHLLTLMDWLVISRSKFGEAASLYSLKPSESFDHSIRSNTSCLFHWFNTGILQ